ncbi:MAG: hypothetical protein JJU36_00390, partial [Phycisphaeraceae bacterium]|nr:hypothetical protein [Phycisphaeraceae bacterium]
MKRRLWQLLYVSCALLILLVLAVVAIHLTLRSDLPRRIVVDALRSQTGLEVEIQSLSVSWWGRTRAEGIAISLPLSNVPL